MSAGSGGPAHGPVLGDRVLPVWTRVTVLVLGLVVFTGLPVVGVVVIATGGSVLLGTLLVVGPPLLIGAGWIAAGVVAARRELAVRREATGRE